MVSKSRVDIPTPSAMVGRIMCWKCAPIPSLIDEYPNVGKTFWNAMINRRANQKLGTAIPSVPTSRTLRFARSLVNLEARNAQWYRDQQCEAKRITAQLKCYDDAVGQ